jgi:Ca-activated chloride channel family protein
MDVKDAFSPEGSVSRFDRAVALARGLVDDMTRRTGEVCFAVAVGKGMGILALPLTDDTEAILGFLEGLSLSTVTGRGTNLESLITAAAGAFREDFPTWRRIILFSDGEGLSGSFSAAVEKAGKAEIRISAVGMGTASGGPVPLDQGYLLGEDGLPVYSFLREEMLRKAAEDTGGIYLPGNREDAAVLLVEQIALRPGEGVVPGFKTEPENRRHIFILLAIGALGMTKLSEKRRRKYGIL